MAIAYYYNDQESLWRCFNDSQIQYVSSQEVVHCQAYLLIYKKIDSNIQEPQPTKENVSKSLHFPLNNILQTNTHISLRNKSRISITPLHENVKTNRYFWESVRIFRMPKLSSS